MSVAVFVFARYARGTAGAQARETRPYVTRVTAQRRAVGEMLGVRLSRPLCAFPATRCAGVMPPYSRIPCWAWGCTEAFSLAILFGTSCARRRRVVQRVGRLFDRLASGGNWEAQLEECAVGYGGGDVLLQP